MSYNATKWDNRTSTKKGTLLNADNMNNLENGIVALDADVSTLKTDVSTVKSNVEKLNFTEQQLNDLATASKSLETLKTLQADFDSLKNQYENHVHSNEVGDTTGKIVVETTNA